MSKKAVQSTASRKRSGSPQTAEAQASAHRRTRQEHSRETAEDYVEAIAGLITAQGEARAVDLARWLGVSHVTVIRTIARLQRDGYVSTKPYRSIFLTKKGSKLAENSRRRHELVQQFLLAIGVPEPVAQSDSEGIEHHCSPETLKAFQEYLEKRA